MNSPDAERGPKVMSEMAHPARITTSGVRHVIDEAPEALAAFSAINRYPESLAVQCRIGRQHREAPALALTKLGDGPYPFRSWLAHTQPGRDVRRGIVYTPRESPAGAQVMTYRFRCGAFVLLLACAATFGGTISPATAQGTVAQREACEGDAFKFCSEFIPFVHAIENCLARNLRKLTPACQIQMRGGTPAPRRRR
jgi:hypothetical protein